MKILIKALAYVAIAATCGVVTAQDNVERVTMPFSDPSRPGVLHVGIIAGSIIVRGRSDAKDVVIKSRGDVVMPQDRGNNKTGLRQLYPRASFEAEERNNRMEISAPHGYRKGDLEIEVPTRTNLELSTVNDGDILVEGVEGELEIGNVNGAITLEDVSGSVVAHTVNGRVTATLTRITPEKTMAFTSLNGAVIVELPADIKANLKLRTDNGKVFTDFELQMLPQSSPIVEDTRRSGGRYRIEVNRMIYGSVNGGGPDIELRTFNGNITVRKSR
jgi:hypothetical protein